MELPVAVALRAPFANEGAIGGEPLDEVIVSVCNVDATARCHHYANRQVELPVAIALRAPFANEHAFGGELLQAMNVSV